MKTLSMTILCSQKQRSNPTFSHLINTGLGIQLLVIRGTIIEGNNITCFCNTSQPNLFLLTPQSRPPCTHAHQQLTPLLLLLQPPSSLLSAGSSLLLYIPNSFSSLFLIPTREGMQCALFP